MYFVPKELGVSHTRTNPGRCAVSLSCVGFLKREGGRNGWEKVEPVVNNNH